jgi:hypothetical protein
MRQSPRPGIVMAGLQAYAIARADQQQSCRLRFWKDFRRKMKSIAEMQDIILVLFPLNTGAVSKIISFRPEGVGKLTESIESLVKII